MAYPDDFIPELWSTRILENLDKQLVLASPTISQNTYESELSNFGDVVHIQQFNEGTAGAYSGTITYGTPTSTTKTLTINQDVYDAENIDNLDRAQANVDILDGYTRRLAYAIATNYDSYIGTLYSSSTLTVVTWDVGTTDAYTVVRTCRQRLDEANVPDDGQRYLVVRPAGYSALLANSSFIAAATDQGAQRVTTGFVGTILGFRVYMSNNLANTTGNFYKYLYGHPMAIQRAMPYMELKVQPRDTAFAVGIAMRAAYGAVAAHPTAFGDITADET